MLSPEFWRLCPRRSELLICSDSLPHCACVVPTADNERRFVGRPPETPFEDPGQESSLEIADASAAGAEVDRSCHAGGRSTKFASSQFMFTADTAEALRPCQPCGVYGLLTDHGALGSSPLSDFGEPSRLEPRLA